MKWITLLELRIEAAQGKGQAAAVLRRAALEKALELSPRSGDNAFLRAVKLVASELGENLSKYNDWQHGQLPVFCMEVSEDKRHLRLRTETRFDRQKGHVEALFAVLHRLQHTSPPVAFRERLLEAAFENLDVATRLGVLRIASEAQSKVEAQVEGSDLLRVFAVVPIEAAA